MLTTRVQHTVSVNAPGKYLGTETLDCICYGDDKDKNKFYVLPTTVVFAKNDQGGPDFNFYKYTGESLNGGYAIFRTMLPFPTDKNEQAQIKSALFGGGLKSAMEGRSTMAVNMCAARAAKDADPENQEKAADYQNKLSLSGLSTEQAEALYFDYNKNPNDKLQFVDYFLPESVENITLQAIDSQNVKASLVIDQNAAFYQQLPASVDPVGGGNNEAIFSLTLTKEGASLFEQVLKGEGQEGSSVGVIYQMDFASSLPAVTVKVTYHAEAFKKFVQNIDRHVWSADEKKITREFTENEGAKVEPIFGASKEEMGMSAEQYEKWKEGIRTWGQDQLAQILSSQTGLDMNMDLINDADGFDNFESSLSQTRNFEREYTENTVYTYNLKPQSILATIESIVGKDKLDSYFHAYNIEDPFFEKLEPEFIVVGNFEKYNIANVIVNVSYNGKPKESILFEQAGTKKAKPWSVNFGLPDPRSYQYNYTVNFEGDDTKAYHSGEITSDGELIININANDSGVVFLDITNPAEESWDVFQNIIFTSEYSSIDPPVAKKKVAQQISKTNEAQPFIYPTGVKQTEPVYFQIEYFTKNGSSFYFVPPGYESPTLPNYGANKGKEQFMPDPLIKASFDLYLINFPKNTQLFLFQLSVWYTNINFKQSIDVTEVVFTGDAIKKTVNFLKMRPQYDKDAVFTFTATVITNGGEKKLPGTLNPDTLTKIINYQDFSEALFTRHI